MNRMRYPGSVTAMGSWARRGRGFVKCAAATAFATLALALAGCVTPARTAAPAAGNLSIYVWFDYLPQALLDKFSAETGIAVTTAVYQSNAELLATLQEAGGLGVYDVAFPSDYVVRLLADAGMLDEIAPGELTHAGNIEARWLDVPYDPGRRHSIPHQWGTTSFAVNRDVFGGDVNTTAILFDPPAALRGRINMLEEPRDVLLLAALHLGIPQCTRDAEHLAALEALLLDARQHWASFGSEIAADALASGAAAASMIYNGEAARARAAGANVEYAYPREGFITWMDNVVLLRDAPNRANAIRFMDFLLVPENIAAVSSYVRSAAGVKGVAALLAEELTSSPEYAPPAEAPPGTFVAICDAETEALHEALRTRLQQ